jgi:hypothetical protein
LKRGAKYKWDEEVIINGEADPFHTENKSGLVKEKRFDLFRSQTIWSTNNAEYILGTKLSRIPVAKYVQELD